MLLYGALFAPPAHAEIPTNPVAAPASLPTYPNGARLSGGDYNPGPGKRYGYDHIYPSDADLEFPYRVAPDMARPQPTKLQPLDPTEISRITTLVEHARATGRLVILAPHNYGQMGCNAHGVFETIHARPMPPSRIS